MLVVGGKILKNMVSTSTLLYNKENIIRSNILLKNENNQLKGKIAQRTSTLKAARISFFLVLLLLRLQKSDMQI